MENKTPQCPVVKRRKDKKKIYIYYEQLQEGRGAYGKVFKGNKILADTDPKTLGEDVAVKLIQYEAKQELLNFLNKEGHGEKLMSELKKFQNHPNLVDIKGFEFSCKTINDKKIFKMHIFMEYCAQRNLEQFLMKQKRELSELEAMMIFNEILSGIVFLHQAHIIHRDIKPENIVCHNGQWKITDFGECKMIEYGIDSTIFHTTKGTPLFASPQQKLSMVNKNAIFHEKSEYTSLTDVYSAGVCLLKLLYNREEWIKDTDFEKKLRNLNDDSMLTIRLHSLRMAGWKQSERKISKGMRHILEVMLGKEEKSRLPIKKILEMKQYQILLYGEIQFTDILHIFKDNKEQRQRMLNVMKSLFSSFCYPGELHQINKQKQKKKIIIPKTHPDSIKYLRQMFPNIKTFIYRQIQKSFQATMAAYLNLTCPVQSIPIKRLLDLCICQICYLESKDMYQQIFIKRDIPIKDNEDFEDWMWHNFQLSLDFNYFQIQAQRISKISEQLLQIHKRDLKQNAKQYAKNIKEKKIQNYYIQLIKMLDENQEPSNAKATCGNLIRKILKQTDYLKQVQQTFKEIREHKLLVSAIALMETLPKFKFLLENIQDRKEYQYSLCLNLKPVKNGHFQYQGFSQQLVVNYYRILLNQDSNNLYQTFNSRVKKIVGKL